MATNYSDFIKNYNTVSPVFEEALKKSAKKLLVNLPSNKIVEAYNNIAETISGFIYDVEASSEVDDVGDIDDFDNPVDDELEAEFDGNEDTGTFDGAVSQSNPEFPEFSDKLSKFLAFSLFNAYLGGFDTDKFADGDIKFGFSGLADIIRSYASSIGFVESEAVAQAESNLISFIRDITTEDYLSGAFYHADMKQVSLLLTPATDENENALWLAEKVFELNGDILDAFEVSLKRTKEVYRKALAATFGQHKYFGILGEKNGDCNAFTVTHDSSELGSYGNYTGSFVSVYSNLGCKVSDAKYADKPATVHQSESRQFDVRTILSSDAPVYFPFKLLEFACKKKGTTSLNRIFYEDCSAEDRKSFEGYCDKFISPLFEDLFKESVTLTLLMLGIVSQADVDDVRSLLMDENKMHNLASVLTETSVSETIRNSFLRLERSLCFMFLVTDFKVKTSVIVTRDPETMQKISKKVVKLTKFKIKVVAPSGYVPADEDKGRAIFRSFVSSSSSDLKITAESAEGYDFIDFNVILDTSATDAPLFGYKAVRSLRENDKSVDKNNMLLGELQDGTEYVSVAGGGSDNLSFQNELTHFIVGDSGSGKGVMTMNIIASFVAAQVPIFYIDRKPDMASLFSYLTDDNMFLVNGGQCLKHQDTFDRWGSDSQALSVWRDYSSKQVPDYVKEIYGWGNDVTDYYTDGKITVGDLVYFRAVLLMAGIIYARNIHRNGGEIYEKLGGDSGIFVVVDEMTNFEMDFEGRFFNRDHPVLLPYYDGKLLAKGAKGDLDKQIDDIKDTIERLQNKLNLDQKALAAAAEAGKSTDAKEKSVSDLALQIEQKQKKLRKLKEKSEYPKKTMINSEEHRKHKEHILYASQFIKKLDDCARAIAEIKNAGFRAGEGECLKSNFLFVGQNVRRVPYNGDYSFDKMLLTDKSRLNDFTTSVAFTKTYTALFPPDFIVGYNSDKLLTAHSNLLNRKDRYFAYVPSKKTTNKEEPRDGYYGVADMQDGTPSGTVIFKPYLVLNTHYECDPNNKVKYTDSHTGEQKDDPRYSFVDQLMNNVGISNWKLYRKDHLKNPEDESWGTLNEGIGFEGLVNETMMANGKAGGFDFKKDLGKSKEIADFVASCFGYRSYQEFLFDFSPKGLFSIKDVCEAVSDPSWYKNYEERFDVYNEYDCLNCVDGSAEVSTSGLDNVVADEGDAGYVDLSQVSASPTGRPAGNSYNNSQTDPEDDDFIDEEDVYDFVDVNTTGSSTADESFGFDASASNAFTGASSSNAFANPAPTSQTGTPAGNTTKGSNPFYNSNVINTGTPRPANPQPAQSQTMSRQEQYQTCIDYINHLRRNLPRILINVFKQLPDDVKGVLNMKEVQDVYIAMRKEQIEKAFGFDMKNV